MKIKILFTATFVTPFIQSDLAVLKKYFPVSTVIRSGLMTFFHVLKHIPFHSVTFSWFASVYSSVSVFLAKRYGKKSIIILGGVDVAKLPEIDYGIWNSKWKSVIVRYGIRNADVVLAVDPSIKNDACSLAKYDGNNISIVPTGYDSEYWIPGKKKDNFVLTVANCADTVRFKVKGIDYLYDIAAQLPDVSFILVGLAPNVLKHFPAPLNVTTHGYLPQKTLIELYQRAKVYIQPSRREGLPNTLCEAMLCECYPIGTDTGGIPAAIGDTGSIVPFGDVNTAATEIQKGLRAEYSSSARNRIVSRFSVAQRESALIDIINMLAHASSATY